ncbi:ComF family protein [Luteolibacter sp. LG18]|uniref:ComF family protein n=1 Tax=Luteolibacter sp. LG18 TaxID=2819286 RepID=UPI002B30CCAE|nr:amidophosphoribosyltransferase [Luteolibacter sp. LG18]
MPDATPHDPPRGWRSLFSRALDLLYPPACGLCRAPLTHGRHLCGPCGTSLPRLTEPYCAMCGEHFDGVIDTAFECPNCRGLKHAFAFARPALAFDPRTRQLVHDLKYHRGLHLAADLGRLAAEAFQDPRLAEALADRWPLVPVPLHRSRQRTRWFNQAHEIARGLSTTTGLPILPALRRIRKTDTQTRLTRAQRLANLKGAFALSRAGERFAAGKPPGAVLVDDVFTTGSTVHECARTLLRGGVQKVIVVTVMRG